VYGVLRRWRLEGTWEVILHALRRTVRQKAGRNADPSVIIIDSRSVKSASKGGQRGFDAGKKTKGRKQHIAVDIMGTLLTVVVHSAGIGFRIVPGRVPG
jgi:putative transposase